MTDAVKVVGLTKRYRDVTAVDGLELCISEGELFGLLGVNGAGKTTTIKMLSCLTQPTEGDAFLLGRSIRKEPAQVKRLIAVSPQETAVAPHLTVKENLALLCGIHGITSQACRQKVRQMMEEFDLVSVETKRAGTLSGGYQRRLSIAMALICEPSILFLDEPTLGLDVLSRNELWNKILSLKGKVTMILTTHYLREAQALCDRVGIMANGKLLRVGTSEELCASVDTEDLEDAFVRIVKGELE